MQEPNCFSPGTTVEITYRRRKTKTQQQQQHDNPYKFTYKRRKTKTQQQQQQHDDEKSQELYLVGQNSIVSYVHVSDIRPCPPQNDTVFSNGSSLPPFHEHLQKESFEMEQGSISRPETISQVVTDSNGKQETLRFKGIKTLPKTKFNRGSLVEVKSDEEGFQGSWYTATIVRSVGINKFLVEYKTLVTEDEMKPLRYIANEDDIRPSPPEIPQNNRYNVRNEVDAWYNDGWWEGSIYKVLDDAHDGKYIVYFAPTKDKMVFKHSNLRPRQNWVDGKWIMTLQLRSSNSRLRSSSSEIKYNQV